MIWDASTQSLELELPHKRHVNSCEFSPDGKLVVTACWDGKARIWDIDKGYLKKRLVHLGCVDDCSLSRDGSLLLTVSGCRERTAYLWDVATGELRTRFVGHTDALQRCVLSEKYLVTTGNDGTARVWRRPVPTKNYLGHTVWPKVVPEVVAGGMMDLGQMK